MAFSTGNESGAPMSEINVTPLVDVMLVLLVIFMVTAPILQTGIDVNLPKTRESRVEQPKPRSVVVSIDKDGNIYLSTQSEARPLNINDLPAPPYLPRPSAEEEEQWIANVLYAEKLEERAKRNQE